MDHSVSVLQDGKAVAAILSIETKGGGDTLADLAAHAVFHFWACSLVLPKAVERKPPFVGAGALSHCKVPLQCAFMQSSAAKRPFSPSTGHTPKISQFLLHDAGWYL